MCLLTAMRVPMGSSAAVASHESRLTHSTLSALHPVTHLVLNAGQRVTVLQDPSLQCEMLPVSLPLHPVRQGRPAWGICLSEALSVLDGDRTWQRPLTEEQSGRGER